MNIGIVGLGRMGSALAYRLLKANHQVIGYNRGQPNALKARDRGVMMVDALEKMIPHTNVIWLMIPAGNAIDEIIEILLPHLKRDYILIDGGNSHFKDSIRRAEYLATKNIYFIDCGTSGGLAGKENGFSLMIGGDKKAFKNIEPFLQAIAAPNGYGHVGPSGAGHYVKMIHNGIEYALMQSYAEGFHLLKEGRYPDLDLEQIAVIWNNGSIIRSWLLHLTEIILKKDQRLTEVAGAIEESGMGSWTVQEAHEYAIAVKLIEDALAIRAASRQGQENYATKIVSLLRNAFGGHQLSKKK